MPTLKRQKADGTWEYLQTTGEDVENLRLDVDKANEELAQIASNVKKYGAKGDGVTDDTQSFINARLASKNIYIPEGVYIVDNLVLENTELYGYGTLLWKPNSTNPMFTFNGRTRLKGITLDGNKNNQTNDIVAITLNQGKYSQFKDITIKDFRFKVLQSSVGDSPFVEVENVIVENCGDVSSCDVFVVRSPNWKFNKNSFDGIGDGHCIRLGLFNNDSTIIPVTDISITNSVFKNTQHNGITCEIHTYDVIIKGNIFEGTDQAIKTESTEGVVARVVIEGNIFKDIALSTALNLSASNISFINNICSNMAGPYFGENYNCSNNKFYNCGTDANPVIGTFGNVVSGIIEGNLIVDAKYRAITPYGGIIKGNRIVNATDIAIRSTQDTVIVGNFIDGATSGIVLSSVSINAIVEANIIKNFTNYGISSTSTDPSVIIGQNVEV